MSFQDDLFSLWSEQMIVEHQTEILSTFVNVGVILNTEPLREDWSELSFFPKGSTNCSVSHPASNQDFL